MSAVRLCGTLALATFLAPLATAQDHLGAAAHRLAQKVKQFADGEGVDAVSIGSFQGVAESVGVPATGIESEFKQAIKKVGLEIRIRAPISLVGNFKPIEDKNSREQAILLTVEAQRKNAPSRTFQEPVRNQAQVLRFAGGSVAFKPDATTQENREAVKRAIDDPRIVIQSDLVRSPGKQPYALGLSSAYGKKTQATALSAYKPIVPKEQEGFAFAAVPAGQVYAVRIVNDSPLHAAVALHIDGLSMFVTSELKDVKGRPRYTQLIVPPKSSMTVRGWFVNLEKSDEFLVGSYAESLAKEFHSPAPTGIVCATFHAAWPKGQQPPADEPPNPDKNHQGADATGRGARFDEKFVEVDFEVGVPRDVIQIRYARPE